MGLENPLNIIAQGYSSDNLKITIDNGHMVRGTEKFNYYYIIPTQPGRIKIKIAGLKNEKYLPIDSFIWGVKTIQSNVAAKLDNVKPGILNTTIIKTESFFWLIIIMMV